ncbi:DUF2157 domain-containing protein [Nitratireductor mangrovi]|uniref:DUF2157 domain-containing protein n=1 Tax=Nitratireductor mangrovi TaxID=2599600 RepID=A0A5B8KUD5_9HYPH|nr:DUF2157 domain-containing protein [Nitratireductor mangrovi]QDY99201.1 DUF2157 domain-containing protein [Nitratireductor mangrovi]
MASHAAKVNRDIERWLGAGMIDAGTAEKLRADVEAHARRGFSFGAILAMLSALLFGAAILIFVAANWEDFPRLARVVMLFAVILGTYVVGAWLVVRDQRAAGEAAWIVGGAAFGASIALIGQMYHLSGDEAAAILTWCFGVAAASLLLRSSALNVGAVALACTWLWIDSWDFWRDEPLPLTWLALAAALWALSLWTQSRAARHLIILALVFYAVMAHLRTGHIAVPIGLAIVSTAFLLAAVHAEAAVERLLRLGGGAAVHALIGFSTAMMLIQIEFMEGWGFILAALVTFAGSIAALVLAGRDSRALRWLAYLLFGVELCVVYVNTVGTMLGTAGFFLAAGLVLAVMAFVIIRLERRLATRPANAGAAT